MGHYWWETDLLLQVLRFMSVSFRVGGTEKVRTEVDQGLCKIQEPIQSYKHVETSKILTVYIETRTKKGDEPYQK